jgi:7,8-dihydropterin-6-yl-methyl-4-(beta-D-ribofuranosyl)aminobenzene 5'-phosphate synthase
MKIIILIENDLSCDLNLVNEFGFSVFIQDEDTSLIFDTGQSGIFIKNIEKLKLDTKNIHTIVLSHNHYDHVGGLKNYIEKFGNNFTLYLNKNFFDKRFSFSELYSRILGANFSQDYILDKKINLSFINEHIHILSKNITAFTNFERLNDFEKINLFYYKKKNSTFILDSMSDEIVLGLDTKLGFFILCGCSHIGIVNIIENIKKWTNKKIVGIIGGLHLSKSNSERILKTINYLKKEDIKYLALSHCTGKNIIKIFKDSEFNILPTNTGNVLEF